ncbi:MAG: N-acetyltransferase [Chitinophagaceae bacterium]|jgi:predicted GNAT family acetyltransferase|nr:N-acetyltransferase [Chitinophagaceae bacterium]OQY96945.1 MAG: hypothetical protein B6D37_00150 [Sphingobacteriales bacterium UTBCD1]
MEIKNKAYGNKSMFYIEQNGKTVARMEYTIPGPGRLMVEHTEVDEVLKGKGAGTQLFLHMAEYARANHLKVSSHCSFTSAMFQRKPEYSDILYK